VRHGDAEDVPLMTRIVLLRHGLSAHGAPTGWLLATDIENWRVEYDAAGIDSTSEPTALARRLATESSLIVASDLVRAQESAARIAVARILSIFPPI